MVFPLLAVLGLFVLQTFVPTGIRHLSSREKLGRIFQTDIGPRDTPLATNKFAERGARALNNMHEALPVFLALALLHCAWKVEDPGAIQGAWIFFVARLFYVPAYITAIPGVRSLCWTAGWVGIVLMLIKLPLS